MEIGNWNLGIGELGIGNWGIGNWGIGELGIGNWDDFRNYSSPPLPLSSSPSPHPPLSHSPNLPLSSLSTVYFPQCDRENPL